MSIYRITLKYGAIHKSYTYCFAINPVENFDTTSETYLVTRAVVNLIQDKLEFYRRVYYNYNLAIRAITPFGALFQSYKSKEDLT